MRIAYELEAEEKIDITEQPLEIANAFIRTIVGNDLDSMDKANKIGAVGEHLKIAADYMRRLCYAKRSND